MWNTECFRTFCANVIIFKIYKQSDFVVYRKFLVKLKLYKCIVPEITAMFGALCYDQNLS